MSASLGLAITFVVIAGALFGIVFYYFQKRFWP